MKTRHTLRVLLAALAAMTLFAASCGGDGDDGASGDGAGDGGTDCPVDALDGADGPVEIEVWGNYTALPKRTFEAMVAEYNDSQDRVRVSYQSQGVAFEEVLRKYKLAAEDDSLPSLVLLEDTTTQVIADSGTIITGSDCYSADPDGEEMMDDFLPIAVASYTVDDVLQPVGFDVYTALVYYNRTHFSDAGLDPNTPPATLEEMRSFAETLKAAGVTEKPVSQVAQSWQVEWWITGADQAIVNEDNGRAGLATESEFASDTTEELYGFWKSMITDELATAYPGIEGQVDQLFSMATNSASMVVDSSAGVNTIAGLLEGTVDPETVEELGLTLPPDFEGLGLDLWVGPFPGIEEAGQGQIGGGAWYLTNGGTSEQQAAAWDFMKWFNSTQQQVTWASLGSGLPVVQSALDSPELQQAWDSSMAGEWNRIAYDVLLNVDTGFPGPLIGDYKTTREAIRNSFEQVVLGDGEVDAAIAAADSSITTAAEEYKATVGG